MMTNCESSAELLAIKENERGVRVLNQGDFPLALELLSSAFRAAKQALQEQGANSRTIATSSLDYYISNDVPSMFLSEDAQQGRFMYKRGILLPLQHHAFHSPYFVMSAVVFNLALAHHCSGQEKPSSSVGREMLAQAAKFYELGYKLQETRPTGRPVYYMMTALNNMGHVFRLLGNERHANDCFSHLLSTLMLVLHNTKKQDEFSNSGNHFRCLEDGFLQNTAYLILGGQGIPAAAA